MSKKYLFNACFIVIVTCLSFNLISCSTNKNIKYFQDIPDSGKLKKIVGAAYSEPTIQVDDIVSISVQTIDPQSTLAIGAGNIPLSSPSSTAIGGGGSAPNQQSPVAGYLVDKDGYVDIPFLGRLKLAGYTTNQAKALIFQEADKYFKNPTVIIRFANFKFSVTGEVARPGIFVSPNEKVSVMDALALAGDLTIFGKRDNVLLIRENADGTKTPYRINLNKSDLFSSQYYYLRQNDLIYVEPGKGKAAANDASQTRTFAILGSLLSVLIVLVSRIN